MIRLGLTGFLSLLFCLAGIAQHTSEIGLGWAGNSVNTVVFRRNSVVSYKKDQFASYYDSAGYVVLAKRKLGTDVWEVKKTQYKGNNRDAHNSISIMVDGEGYLHLSWDHHASKLRYCKSTSPGSLEMGAELPMTGKNEARVTYPEFYKLTNGDLLFLYRDGASGQGNLILNRYNTKEKTWQRVQDNLLDGENQRNAYWQACIDTKGTFHISWVWREKSDVATNHDMCYAKSEDGGKTWTSYKNAAYKMPINAASAEPIVLIPQKSELINSTSITTNKKGVPYIATYWRPAGTQVPQFHIIYLDGKEWKVQQVSNRITPFSLSGAGTKKIPVSRPQLIIDGKQAFVIYRDAERGDKVSASVCTNLKKKIWTVKDITHDFYGQWEPSYDTELWKEKKQLHLFVQQTAQGDGEKVEAKKPQMVKIIEVK